ncbi:MAG: FKBP-type peptidyl-prolyl cis-trans isomerase, partial [Planctomycetaceae bacterium]
SAQNALISACQIAGPEVRLILCCGRRMSAGRQIFSPSSRHFNPAASAKAKGLLMFRVSMRYARFAAAPLVLLSAITMAADEPAEKPAIKLETTKDKASYGIGFNIGSSIRREGLDLDAQTIAAGIAAALKGEKSAIAPEEVQAAIEEMAKAKSATKLTANQKFLDENKAKKGVKTTKSGLQYMVIKEGDGAVPTAKSTVKTHYRGKLLNGNVFDESYKGEAPTEADEPVSFGVTQVIKGWAEALQLMKTGSYYRLFIPSELAYGERGAGGAIGPNEVLVFEIHLLESKDE